MNMKAMGQFLAVCSRERVSEFLGSGTMRKRKFWVLGSAGVMLAITLVLYAYRASFLS
jgi:hypothetical protein